jgi:hypothetical protein
MVFTKRLREGIRRGEITCSARIWMSPRVRVGARYRSNVFLPMRTAPVCSIASFMYVVWRKAAKSG